MPDFLSIRPGTLVALHTKVRGGVNYQRVEIEDRLEGSTEVKVWETTKIVTDIEEHNLASEVRKNARALIAGGCQWTPFGLICLEGQEEELDRRIARARDEVAAFNSTARHTQVSVGVLRGRISRDDQEAISAIREEISGLLSLLEKAMASGEVKTIRDLCRQAKTMERLIEENTPHRDRLGQAVSSARQLARKIVSEVEKKGESLEGVLRAANFRPVSVARFQFLGRRPGERKGESE